MEALLRIATVLGLGGILGWVLTSIALWRIFSKAGRPGWAGLIPLYNLYVLFDIAWETKLFWYEMLLVSAAITTVFVPMEMGTLYGVCTAIAALVMGLVLMFRLANAFGKGVGFALGLILMTIPFLLILALGDAQYIPSGRKLPQGRRLGEH